MPLVKLNSCREDNIQLKMEIPLMKKIILLLSFVMMAASCAPEAQLEETTTEAATLVGEPETQTSNEDVLEVKLEDSLSEYNYVDPQHIVPTTPLSQALKYFKANKAAILNQKYITIIDMTQKSNKKRMYVIDMKSGVATAYLAAHGKNSDKNNDGYADTFSNTEGSLMSSLGFYLTGVTYQGSNGLSLRLHGLQSTNSNAYRRAIVVHGADYVNPSSVGRSWGCPAIERKYVNTLMPALKGKSLLYVYKTK
jgi:L,D-transpeptidase catalytic domain